MPEVLSAKSALIAIKKLQARLDAMEGERAEPIAIVGIGCRLPGGVQNPEGFWRLLRDGVDAITEVPPDRWAIDDYYDPDPSALGKMATRWGAFLDKVDGFDPEFFGLSPREAASMDPQQRLLLEVAWEALEDAGIAADQIAGTRTGVFVGLYNNDYAQLQLSGAHADAHSALGSALGIAPGRLSYLLDLQGPSLLVDTLCSSSAVAVHLACQSLRSHECSLALAGGVNLILSPYPTIATSRLLALSPDGRCKTFDSRANGFVRGEGCGMVALKRLSNALADGDPIWALIRGSAVNQDGRSTGLTAPNALAQQAVIRQALDNAGVKPEQVGYVEAHGTGTSLGDPIEVDALRAVYGRPRGDGQTCALGSVKTNLGHMEASAGIAGLIKAVLTVRYGEIPPLLHFRQLNPRISLAGTPFVIPTALRDWPSSEGRRFAGVSALGMSGTNAHIIVEERPGNVARASNAEALIPSRDRQGAVLLTLSARSEPALRELAGRYRNYLVGHPEADLAEVCFTSQTGRTHFEHRLALVAGRASEAITLLDLVPESRVAAGAPPKLAFLFTGQGAQYAGMGRELYEQEPLFRAALEQCAEIARPLLDVPLLSLLFETSSEESPIGQTAYTQVALFALEWSLARVWMAWGVKPDYVLGHSLGEYVAACVAGAFSIEEGLKLVAARGQLMQTVKQAGSMATVYASQAEVAAAISNADVSIAAINAPKRTVISGPREAIEAACTRFAGMAIQTKALATSQAWHSPLMDPILDEFEHMASQVAARPLAVPLVSNLTGDVITAGATIDARYWRRHLRETVQFARGIETLAARGCEAYVEIGPHPTLIALGPLVLPSSTAQWLPSLRRGAGRKTMLESLGRLYLAGAKPEWKKLYAEGQRRCASLPTYPFQRERFWAARKPGAAIASPAADPLLGSRLRSALPEIVFESQLSVEALPFLGDHRVQGVAVLPAAAMAIMARKAAAQAMPGERFEVTDMLIREPLLVPEESPRTTQFVLTPGENRVSTFRLYSLESERWLLHAEGSLGAARPVIQPDSLDTIRDRCREELSVDSFYKQLGTHGLDYGPLFQGLTSIFRNGAEALGLVEVNEDEPALLDACFQLLGVLLADTTDLYLPLSIERLRWESEALESGWVHARLRESNPGAELRVGDVTLYNTQGRLVLAVEGLTLGRLRRPVGDATTAATKWLHAVEWRPEPLPPLPDTIASTGRWLLFADSSGIAERLEAELRRLGQEVSLVDRGVDLKTLDLRCRGVIYLGSLEDSLEACVRDPLLLTQALMAQGATPTVCWVTRGAQSDKPQQATLWGFGAVLAREHPELPCVYFDLDPGLLAASGATMLLASLLVGEQKETRRMLRGGTLYVQRLVRASVLQVGAKPVRLEASASSELDQLRLAPMQRRGPGPGEVELRVEATGLNFRDVLKGLGLLPGQSGPPGFECAGRIEAVGAGVRDLEIGDRVAAIAVESFASYVTVAAALAARIPPNLSTVEAATIPVVFLTVLYALREIAGLRAGERLLVHSAAGGVGLAAIQWTHNTGARVYGTVGNAHKRALLEAMGVEVIGSSRQLPEVEEMRQAVGGEGVDVLVNALSGEAIERSLQLLKPGGRFIELGRRGIWSAEQVAALRPDVAYHVVNLHEIAEREPEVVGGWLRELMALFGAGTLRPLPLQTFSLKNAAQAFRVMAQGQHVGKLAVVMDGPPEGLSVSADGAYLITGGRGGVGLALAQWLAEQGARNIVLASRHAPDKEQQARIETLREAGAQVTTVEVDVSDYEALRTKALFEKTPPLRGVIHAAGVLDDGPLVGQDWERMSAVLAPKVAGASALHRLTAGQKLDFFILCSSVASVLGSAGQAAYAAGNAFLDALAHLRRGRGEPALSINWGPVADVGLAAQMGPRVRAHWAAAGIDFIPRAALGPALLEAARTGQPQVAVLAVDWKRMQTGPAVDRLLSELVSAKPRTESKRALPLPESVRAAAASVLGLASENVPVDRPLQELGLDSLMAVELRNRLARELERPLPATLVFDHPTVSSLVDYLFGEKGAAASAAPTEISPSEAIAIIGMGCRFPGGVTTPEQLWRLLAEGVDAITEVPPERWDMDVYYDPNPATPGKSSSRWGGFVEAIDRFDAGFFGISPREAVSMDPQQRLLLEASWEALERAGVAPGSLGGSLTGVFVGISTTDYSLLQMRSADSAALDIYFGTGSAVSVAAGRLAYALGLQGPCMALDTACSSSLTAVHLACQSLRLGECNLALAGGVNAILTPDAHVNFSQAHMLALDGRCKSFDASADGYVRGEGCGMLVLKRVSDALRDGDPILAVVRGSAVNQDGRSNGLTAPNGPAQEAVIRAALHRAGVRPDAVGMVEAHGTGTLLGDPIEMQALGGVLAEGRATDLPVMVGSIKSNLGHLEAAAGAAGLMKVVLALQHGEIPPSLHFRNPNPHILWEQLPVGVPTALTPWPIQYQTRIAGISGFGISGTNAHVVLEQAPVRLTPETIADRPYHVLALSAKSPDALRQLAQRYDAFLAGQPSESFADVCHTTNTGRTHFAHRLAIVAASSEDARAKLVSAEAGHADAPPKIAFLFTGQGAQYAGMGRQLYERHPTFRAALDRCAAILAGILDVPLLDLLYGGGDLLGQTRYAQPALVALEWSLAELWESWGIVPDAVLGHSVGECAAACRAGVLGLEEALKLAAVRGQLMEDAAGGGAMATVFADAAKVADALTAHAGNVAIAAINSPYETVISGEREAVTALQDTLAAAGIKSRKLPLEYAFHSPLINPILDDFERAAERFDFQIARLPFVSTLTGETHDASMNAAYWRRQAREPVQFAKAIETLRAFGHKPGHTVFIEIGPRPTLLAIGQRNVDESACLWLPSLRKEGQDWETVLDSLARLYTAGANVDWAGLDSGCPRRRVVLPTYPFQRERYWIQPARRETPAPAMEPASLLGQRLNSPALDAAVFETILSADSLDLLRDHRIFGTAIMPGAGYVTQALMAAKEALGDGQHTLEEFTIHEAMVLPESEPRVVQVVVKPGDNSSFQVHSREKSGTSWTLHATGRLGVVNVPAAAVPDLPAIRKRCSESLDGADFYIQARERHIEFGPTFQKIDRIWRADGEALGQIHTTDSAAIQTGLIDACFQLMGAAAPVSEATPVPVGFDRLRWHGIAEGDLWGYARLRDGALRGDVQLFNERGIVLEIEGLHLKHITPPRRTRDWLYQIAWQPAAQAVAAERTVKPVRWLIYADQRGLAETLQGLLTAGGDDAALIQPGEPLPHGYWHGVVYLSALDVTDPTVQDRVCGGAIEIFRSLASVTSSPPRVWLVTAGSQSGAAPAQSPLWGLGRTARWEHPELWGGLVDLDAGAPPAAQAEALLAELWSTDGEREVAYRDGRRHVPRLVRFAPSQPAGKWNLRADAAYVITGGLGALGIEVARRMVAGGARHLVLMGRSKPAAEALAAGALEAIDALRQSGANLRIVSADVTREAELAGVLKEIADGPAPLRGIVHAAGVLDDGMLANLDWDRFQKVLAPKVLGAWNLHRQTRDLPLDFFVLFSSLSSAFGAPGQANYAAANAFLDGLAGHRRQMGLPALSLNWAPWAEVGMAAERDGKMRRWTGQGLFPLQPAQALDALEVLAGESAVQVCVVHADWPRFLDQVPQELSASLFAEFDRRPPGTDSAAFRKQLQQAAAARRGELLVTHVREQVAAALNLPQAGALPLHQGFFDLGMDSLMAMEVRNRLQTTLGLTLPATVVLENGTIAALAAHLDATLFPPEEASLVPAAVPDEELDALLAEIENLPESEIDRELAGGAGIS